MTPHSFLHFFLLLDFPCQSQNLAMNMLNEEVGVDDVEDLVDKPGTKNGALFDILQSINSLAISDEMWFLTAGPMVCIPMIFAEIPK